MSFNLRLRQVWVMHPFASTNARMIQQCAHFMFICPCKGAATGLQVGGVRGITWAPTAFLATLTTPVISYMWFFEISGLWAELGQLFLCACKLAWLQREPLDHITCAQACVGVQRPALG